MTNTLAVVTYHVLLCRFSPFVETAVGLPHTDALYHSLGTCHSLARLIKKHALPGEPDSEIIGDPLEIKMFEMAKWQLHEPRVGTASRAALQTIMMTHTVLIPSHAAHGVVHEVHRSNAPVNPQISLIPGDPNTTCFAMIRQFTFSSALQRMAVIVGGTNGIDHQGPLFIYAKVCALG